jgi:F-type H+-transporting ATPase subunit epsilon
MNTFTLTVASPLGNVFDGEAFMLTVRGIEGELAIMAGHAAFITTVKPCDCKIELTDGSERVGATDGGLLNVGLDKVMLLSGSFRWKE